MPPRFLDPHARVRSFAARAGGMRDEQKLNRRLRRIERSLEPEDDEGDTPDGWSMVEEVNALPAPAADTIGRMFLTRAEGVEDVLSVGLTAPDGTPILVGLNTLGPDDAAVALVLQPVINFTAGALGVAIDASGNLYASGGVYSGFGNGVAKFNASLVLQWENHPAADIRHASTDGTNLYYADVSMPVASRIRKVLTSNGAAGSPASFGAGGGSSGQFRQPHGVANNATHVFVTDRTRNVVLKFTPAGVFVSEFGAPGVGQGQFDAPTGITLDAAGNIYVCDTGNNRVQKFDSGGTWLATFGGIAGNGDGQLNAPEGIAVDGVSGDLWIADTGNHRIQVLNASGAYVAKIGSYGSGASNLNTPRDIVLGDGIGYVADFGNNRVCTVKVAAEHSHTPVVTERSASGTANNNAFTTLSPTCNANEVVVGGGFLISNTGVTNVEMQISRKNGNGWWCQVRNVSGASQAWTCYAMCLEVPVS